MSLREIERIWKRLDEKTGEVNVYDLMDLIALILEYLKEEKAKTYGRER